MMLLKIYHYEKICQLIIINIIISYYLIRYYSMNYIAK